MASKSSKAQSGKRRTTSTAEKSRERIAAQRAAEQAKARRRTLLLIGIAVVVGLGLVAAAAVPLVLKAREQGKPVADFGVSAAAAQCGTVIDDASEGNNVHVGPGTDQPTVSHIDYDTNPPSHGSHFAEPAGIGRHFYTSADVPPVEQLVHNLEHGYTVVWYDDTVAGDQLSDLEALATKVASSLSVPKFIVAPWDDSRGPLDDGHVALVHWSQDAGHRQYCGQVSGEAIQSFVDTYPYTDSWEPYGA